MTEALRKGDFARVTSNDRREDLVGKTGIIIRKIPINKAYVAFTTTPELTLIDLDNLEPATVNLDFADPGYEGLKTTTAKNWDQAEVELERHYQTHTNVLMVTSTRQVIAVADREPGDEWKVKKRFRAE